MGRIFDDRGNRMTPTYAVKKGIRYRYYISAPLLQGQSDKAAKLNRVPAAEIEQLTIGAVRKHLAGNPSNKLEAEGPDSLNDKELISAWVARGDVKRDHLAIRLSAKSEPDNAARHRRPSAEDVSDHLGFAGPAVTHARLPKIDRAYLSQMPERRSDPPEGLVAWISERVEKGVQAGFLKRHHGLTGVEPSAQQKTKLKNMFEISHDSLSDLFQQFSVEFESWVRNRWAKLAGVLFVGLFFLPFMLYIACSHGAP